jgi:hypothetical protein
MVLSGLAFAVLWEKLALGAFPRALFQLSPGATERERAHAEHVAATELWRLGLGQGDDLDHELVATLRLLAKPEVECYGWFVPAAGRPVGVLGAESAGRAVLAWQDAPIVELMPVGPGELPRVVACQLPPLAAATREVVLAEHSVRAFEYAVRDTVTGHGQLFAAARDRFGRRRQQRGGVEYVDTPNERWLLRRDAGRTTASPGAVDVIAAALEPAVRRLGGTRPSKPPHATPVTPRQH